MTHLAIQVLFWVSVADAENIKMELLIDSMEFLPAEAARCYKWHPREKLIVLFSAYCRNGIRNWRKLPNSPAENNRGVSQESILRWPV